MSYSGLLRYKADAGGLFLSSVEKLVNGRVAFGPVQIHLRAGEVAKNVTIGRPLATQPSQAPTYLLLATDRPGVRFRLASGEGSPTCRGNGLLLTGVEDISTIGVANPYFTAKTWLNGTGEIRFAAQTDNPVSYGGQSWLSSNDSIPGNEQAVFVWGVDDYVDLGRVDDGKEFRFWLKATSELISCYLEAGSYPYTGTSNDADVVGGGQADSAVVTDAIPSPYYRADITAQLELNKWCFVTVKKSDFVATGSPLWNRITQLRINNQSGGGISIRGASIYFGDQPDNLLTSVRILSVDTTTRTALNLSLDAPQDADASVVVIGLVQ